MVETLILKPHNHYQQFFSLHLVYFTRSSRKDYAIKMKTYLPFFLFLFTAVHGLQCKEDQQLSLLHFKKSLVYNSSVSSKLISWNSSTNCCSWIGVTCSTNGSVISLDISRESISAGIDNSSSLLDLQHLQCLNMASNNFVGTFPKEFFQVPSLETLDLSDNPKLQGSLPEFPKNGSLRSLILRETSFSGLLPNSFGNLEKLSTIDIEECSFSGSIPRSIGNLTQLVQFSMSFNYFKGPVPSFSRAKNLAVIDLSFNFGLTGPINSTSWENLTDLFNLNLGFNMLDGNIPSALFSLPLLYSLILSNNQFSGPFHQISNFSSCLLEFLELSNNNLEGPIPITILNIRGLQSLALSSNKLNGTFPINSLHQFRNLSYLDLSQNSLLLGLDATNFSYSSFPQFRVLRLASGKLRSPFPEFLRNQNRLKHLDLSQNQIHGKIPNWVWGLSKLYILNLSSNSLNLLEGPLPNPMPSTLRVVDLHSNQLQGKIPVFSSPHVLVLDYSRNNFSSSIAADIGAYFTSDIIFFSVASNNLHGIIPRSICNSQSLEILDLSNNALSGSFPQCLTTMKALAVLNLGRNNLTGYIADKFPQSCSLQSLDLSGNQIQGQFPKSLADCTKLEVLNLGNNQITDAFPCFLKNITKLRVLVLRSNKFYGCIGCPKTNDTWPMLQIIDLAYNNFDGEIPGRSLSTWQAMMANEDEAASKSNHLQFHNQPFAQIFYQDAITVIIKGVNMELVKILTVFTLIDFSCNKFNGTIPEEIGEFKSLHLLNLSNNAFTGEMPSSLGKLQQLESLDLSQNNLSGQIPPQLAKLTFLSFLNVSYNKLVGEIPRGTQMSTFPKTSFVGNEGLYGPPLTAENRTMLSPPTLEGSHQNSGDEIDWISVEIGFTFGFGIAIGSLLFYKRWKKWYYRAMFTILLKIFPQLEERILVLIEKLNRV